MRVGLQESRHPHANAAIVGTVRPLQALRVPVGRVPIDRANRDRHADTGASDGHPPAFSPQSRTGSPYTPFVVRSVGKQ